MSLSCDKKKPPMPYKQMDGLTYVFDFALCGALSWVNFIAKNFCLHNFPLWTPLRCGYVIVTDDVQHL